MADALITIPSLQDQIAMNGINLIAKVTAEMLTETTANTAQLFTVKAGKKGLAVKRVVLSSAAGLEDDSDAAFNSTAITVGDASDPDRLLGSTELNVNGTEVLSKVNEPDYVYTDASETISITVNSMTGKSLSNIDTGEFYVGFELQDIEDIRG